MCVFGAYEHNEPVTLRAAGQGRYAYPEREQRWVLSQLPDGRRDPVAIIDHYIDGTRLRLRRLTEDAGHVTFKLGQKVRTAAESPALVKLTTMYLSEGEYGILKTLTGHEIRKRRWHWTRGDRTLAVDEFGGDLTGLILAEVELLGDESRLAPPPFALSDVTDDDRFSGGRLARTTAEELKAWLAGLDVVDQTP
jgi:CYTH domain-containing protein